MELPALLGGAAKASRRILCVHVLPSIVDDCLFEIDGERICLADYQSVNPPERDWQSLERSGELAREVVRTGQETLRLTLT